MGIYSLDYVNFRYYFASYALYKHASGRPMFQKAAAIIAAIKQNLNPCFWTTSSSPAAIICFFSHFWRRILVSGTQISFLPPLMPPLFMYSKSSKSGEHFHYLSFFLKISSLCCTDPLAITQLRQPQC